MAAACGAIWELSSLDRSFWMPKIEFYTQLLADLVVQYLV
jgi:hypothetical protein